MTSATDTADAKKLAGHKKAPGEGDGHDGGHDDAHAHGPAFLQHHFDTPAQQFDAAKLGMWTFLGQELLFFSGLFVAYGIFRGWYPEAFSAASHELNKQLGALNTIVLLFSSLTAALAVRSSQLGKKDQTSVFLIITIVCAFLFLGVKYFEYGHKFQEGLLPARYFGQPSDGGGLFPESLFHRSTEVAEHLPAHAGTYFGIYFVMTGVHAVHILVGIGVLVWILRRNQRGDFSKEYFTPVDLVALYWHLVDLVWIYLFPMLYLID
jgi:cytochrome c oxidase subunit III